MAAFLERSMPREDNFFEMFVVLAENANDRSAVLVEMLQKDGGAEKYARRIKDMENAGENLTHTFLTRLNQTFCNRTT